MDLVSLGQARVLRFSASEHRSDAFQTVLANACQRVKLTENLPRPFENILAYRNGSAQIVDVAESCHAGKFGCSILCDILRIAARRGPVGRHRRRNL